MATKLLSIALIATLASALKQYVATFDVDNSGVAGSVIVDNGQITVSLDLSSMPSLPNGFSSCINGGLGYHIHKEWKHNDTDDRLGMTECGPLYTAGHYDPWQACGPASGNQLCQTKSTKSNDSCIPTTSYDPNITVNPFSVEVGDWSGKYGKISLDADNKYAATTFKSFYEVQPDELDEFSVVFHCNNGDRAFCAPFEESTVDTAASIPSQGDDKKTVIANFGVLSDGSFIKLSPDGHVTAYIDPTDVADPTSAGCPAYEYTIFNPSSTKSLETSALRADCKEVVDKQYDPTHQCLAWSDSSYCTDGALCDDPLYSYDCEFAVDRYSCAPGDLSGKFTTLDPTKQLELNEETSASLIPITNDLIGKIIAFHCPYEDQEEIEYLACAPIEAITEMITTDSPDFGDDVDQISFIMASIVSLVVALLY